MAGFTIFDQPQRNRKQERFDRKVTKYQDRKSDLSQAVNGGF